MPEKYLRVTMPDGSKWDVSAKVIAGNRAEYYADDDPDTSYDEEYELQDWAANNMNWHEVKDIAKKAEIEPPAVDYQEGWVNGEKEIVIY
jgi:hypothetical protein